MSKWGFACCPKDGEPLIPTFEVAKKEFYCMVCGTYWEFLSPVGKPDDTPGLGERYLELKAKFDAGERSL
jgi:hypothetical protein